MNSNVFLYTFILCALFLLNNVNAQSNYKPGYIVTLNEDTIHGMVDYRGATRNSKIVNFKTETGQEQKYESEELKAYGVEGFLFRSYKASSNHPSLGVIEKSYFFKVLESGKVALLYVQDEYNNVRYFLLDGKGELMELSNTFTIRKIGGESKKVYDNKYLAVLRVSLTGCDKIDNLTIDVKLQEKPLRELIQEYNSCFSVTQNTAPVVNKKAISVKPEIYVGYAWSRVVAGKGWDQSLFVPIEGYKRPMVSAVLKISSHKFNRALALNIGLDYVNKGSIGKSTKIFDYHYLDARLYPTYTWPKGTLRPVVSAGFLYGIRLNSAETAVTQLDKSGERQRFGDFEAKSEVGYGGEVGADYILKKSSMNAVNIRFGYTNALMSYNLLEYVFYNESIYCKIGYAF